MDICAYKYMTYAAICLALVLAALLREVFISLVVQGLLVHMISYGMLIKRW